MMYCVHIIQNFINQSQKIAIFYKINQKEP